MEKLAADEVFKSKIMWSLDGISNIVYIQGHRPHQTTSLYSKSSNYPIGLHNDRLQEKTTSGQQRTAWRHFCSCMLAKMWRMKLLQRCWLRTDSSW